MDLKNATLGAVPPDWTHAAPAARDDTPEHLDEVAGQFEALLVGQMLKSMRESVSGGWLGTGDDPSGGAVSDLAEQHLAAVIAANGGFGLAATIRAALAGRARS